MIIREDGLIDPWEMTRREHPQLPFAARIPPGSPCPVCRGARKLCGRGRCPVIVRWHSMLEAEPLVDSLDLQGSSPPGVFVGRLGYPYVYTGPLIPPVNGDTSRMDTPELWGSASLEEIVRMRSMLVRGKHLVRVDKPSSGGRILEQTREVAMARAPAETEATFAHRPRGSIVFDDYAQPFGPSAKLDRLRVDGVKVDRRVETMFYDVDMGAREAVLSLYGQGVLVSCIQRAFSAGLLGVEKRRRLVPTRWSITAVDSAISSTLTDTVKTLPELCEWRLHESTHLDNTYLVLLIPGRWSYELVEAWHPGTAWNEEGRETMLYSSREGFEGRSSYAEIGGCYYAARLAVAEHLTAIGRQATAVILREARKGYIMPVGVWHVRENVRRALRSPPLRLSSLEEALGHAAKRLQIPMPRWVAESRLLRDALYRRSMLQYI